MKNNYCMNFLCSVFTLIFLAAGGSDVVTVATGIKINAATTEEHLEFANLHTTLSQVWI